MNYLRRALLAFTVMMTLALCVGVQADSKLDISNWKEILPESMYAKLVEESGKKLTSYTASASQFNQNGKRIQAEATNIIVYAEIAQRAGQANAGALRKVGEDLLEAAKAKKADECKALAAKVNDYKKLTGSKSADLDLAKSTSLGVIMDVSVKDIDRNLTPYSRLTSVSIGAKGKAEEVESVMYKLAALSVATTAHVPTADLPKGKTAKDWLDASEDMRKHALAAASAAKGKKVTELKKAVNDLKAACSKCHEDFRVESN